MSRVFFSQPAQEWPSPQPEQPAQQPLPCRRRHIAQAIPPATAAAARIRMTTSAAVIRSPPYITIIIPLVDKDIHGFSERKSIPASVILFAVPGNRLPPPEKRPQTPEPPKGGDDKASSGGGARRSGTLSCEEKRGTGHEAPQARNPGLLQSGAPPGRAGQASRKWGVKGVKKRRSDPPL